MTESPLFSILIANYNGAGYLECAVLSAVKQTYACTEIVVVDDGSTDESWSLLRELSVDYPKLRIHKNSTNKGVGFTKRRLVDLSRGALFGFLDSDDSLRVEAVALMVQAHVAHPECGAIHSRQANCDAALKSLGTFTGIPLEKGESLLSRGGSLSHFCVFKKHFYEMTSGIDPIFRKAEDIDLYLKMEEISQIGHIPEALYDYRIHSLGMSQSDEDISTYFWYTLARYEACKRRGLDPEDLLLHDTERHFGQIGALAALRELNRCVRGFVAGKWRGLNARWRRGLRPGPAEVRANES